MTRIPSLFVASALAILPIGAFAQSATAPAKTSEPSAMTTTTAPVSGKSASTTQTTKPDTKTPATVGKTEMHGMNTVASRHHAKTSVPAKTAEPTKS